MTESCFIKLPTLDDNTRKQPIVTELLTEESPKRSYLLQRHKFCVHELENPENRFWPNSENENLNSSPLFL